MRVSITTVIVAIVGVMFTSGCTQHQQEGISSSKVDSEIQERWTKRIDEATSASQRTTDWLKTETNLRTLDLRLGKAKSDGKLAPLEAQSLQQSTDEIRTRLQAGIKSGKGLDSTETDQILSDIKAVDQRLNGLLAGRENTTY
ncbi:MAG: hypothetical protein K2W95_29240 [Candidatus Obscuribacterales bacterium]|nr:hypothetical protein [Candidatus Obscuribacterales bacterium]